MNPLLRPIEHDDARSDLAGENQVLHSLFANMNDAIARFDPQCRYIYANPAFCRMTGLPESMHRNRTASETLPESHGREFDKALRTSLNNGRHTEFEYSWHTDDGDLRTCHFWLSPILAGSGRATSTLAVGRDISPLKESERRLQRTEAHASIGHWEWHYNRNQSRISGEARRIFGLPPDTRPSLDDLFATLIDEDRAQITELLRSVHAQQLPELSCVHRTLRGNEVVHLHSRIDTEYGADGQPLRLLATTQDISQLKRYESRLDDAIIHDPLTGLPNRLALNNRLYAEQEEALRKQQLLGLLVIDLDRFKEINDSRGHAFGDQLLQQVARRLSNTVRSYDMVARLGGDEFAIVLPAVREVDNITQIATKLLDNLALPFRIEQQELFISASIGISAYPVDTDGADKLLQYADLALYEAKARGRAGFRCYSQELTRRSKDRTRLEGALRHAESNGELDVHFQPKVSLTDGNLQGAEALLRWQHPVLGNVPPDKFIGIAEETGLIVSMGAWILTKACLAIKTWNQHRDNPLKMAVNLSPRQFRDDDLVATVRNTLAATGCRPQWLELEITESLLLDNDERVRSALDTFRGMGISIAIDDFGTGYSALGYLKRFPIDVLKIDRSFVQDVMRDHGSTELVKAIIMMARGLGLEIVAEGIETNEQESFLQAHGCHLGQGYLYSKPVPQEMFETLPLMSGIFAL